jgi:putative alpha-1,2-mannosidase
MWVPPFLYGIIIDCGQMSSWYILNSLGFYPVNPASAEYLIGSPVFDKVEVQFPLAASPLTITAEGASGKPYVAGVAVDGQSIAAPVLQHKTLMQTKSLDFSMSAEPQMWGANQL